MPISLSLITTGITVTWQQVYAVESDDDDKCDVNANWALEAHYKPLQPGSRSLAVLSQPEPMKRTLRAAFRRVVGDAIFVSAYPTINTSEVQGYQRSILYDCAKRLNYKELAKRLKSDDELVRICASVVCEIFFFDMWKVYLFDVLAQCSHCRYPYASQGIH